MQIGKFFLVSFVSVLLVSGCASTQVEETGTATIAQNSYTFNESLSGRGGMFGWKTYSSYHSESPVWRQIDQPFSFTYPVDWKLEETLSEVSISSEDYTISFAAATPKNDPLQSVEVHCQEHANSSDQTIFSQDSVTIGNKDAHAIQYTSTSDPSAYEGLDRYTGNYFCIGLGEDWMDIYAPVNVDLEELMNILATMEFGGEPLFE